jgi:hypothetical protein
MRRAFVVFVNLRELYHIAVLQGILSITSFFLFLLKGERSFGEKRFVFLALSGVSLASTVASRPNLIIFFIVAIPIFISLIKNSKTRFYDLASFLVPTILLGALIMVYNYLRFGSVFDFGTAYQLTVYDTSKYSFSFSLIIPAIYHYFVHAPSVNQIFPYIHPAARIFNSYGKVPYVYLDKTVGAFFFPATWGIFLTPFVFENNKKARNLAYLSLVSVVIVAIIDMCFGGVHLRYAADIMFVLTLLGILICSRLVQYLNASDVISRSPKLSSTFNREEQPSNASAPMEVTVSGMTMEESEWQSRNAPDAMERSPFGMRTLTRFVHLSKVFPKIRVMRSGI